MMVEVVAAALRVWPARAGTESWTSSTTWMKTAISTRWRVRPNHRRALIMMGAVRRSRLMRRHRSGSLLPLSSRDGFRLLLLLVVVSAHVPPFQPVSVLVPGVKKMRVAEVDECRLSRSRSPGRRMMYSTKVTMMFTICPLNPQLMPKIRRESDRLRMRRLCPPAMILLPVVRKLRPMHWRQKRH